MKFSDIVSAARALLQKKGRVTHRALAREFELDPEALQDLIDELVMAERVALDEDGKVLIWAGTQAEAASTPPAHIAADPRPAPDGDRRQLSVMFCDLVGSTALSEQMDPEDLHELVTAYQQTVLRVVQRYEGYVAQYLGDGILAYFGYPVAHEDDAVRAVRAGLEILAGIGRLAVTPPVQVRVGLHTGPVVIGAVGDGDRTEQLALGKTPNIAARVQGAAQPQVLTISGATYKLVQGLFDCMELGTHGLKGIAEPVALYQVLQPTAASSRFEVQVQRGLTHMQGRSHELDQLLQRWHQARAGKGQVVLLSGDAGIGKSRLVQALGQETADDGALRLSFRCSSLYVNSPLHPVIEQLSRMVQVDSGEVGADRIQHLEQFLAPLRLNDPRSVSLFAQLLYLPVHQSKGNPASARDERKATLQALTDWLMRLANTQPVLVVFEDLHWADPSTLELLAQVMDRLPLAPLLLAVTYRSEFTPPWPLPSHALSLPLRRLSPSDIAGVAAEIAGRPVPPEVLEVLIRKTDGVPLYVEELIKDLLDSQLLRVQAGKLQLATSALTVAVPFSLQDSLNSRLDRLGTVRRLAEVASVLGREFSDEWIRAVYDGEAAMLASGLQALCTADILVRQDTGSQHHYTFRHELMRDAAYGSLLIRRRQQLHARVGRLLESVWTKTAQTTPELVAHHFTEAGLVSQAVGYWQRAGLMAVERSANQEAIRHFSMALQILHTLPASADRDRQELGLLMGLGVPLSVTVSWAAPEVRAANERALELCRTLGESSQMFRALFGVWSNLQVQADYRAAWPVAEQLLALSAQADDDGMQLQAHRAKGILALHTGQFTEALRSCDAGLALYDPARHRAHVAHYWLDPGVGCLSYGAFALVCMGQPDLAQQRATQALAVARQASHDFSEAYALLFLAVVHHLRREAEQTRLHAQALRDLSSDKGFPALQAWGTLLLGSTLAQGGRAAEGIALIREAEPATRSAGARVAYSASLMELASLYLQAGQPSAGLAVVDEGLAFAERSGERFYEAELLRVRGELRLLQGAQVDCVLDDFTQAMALARQQQARLWQLRAATSLARLQRRQGQPALALAALCDVLQAWNEGLETPDITDARALTDSLTCDLA